MSLPSSLLALVVERGAIASGMSRALAARVSLVNRLNAKLCNGRILPTIYDPRSALVLSEIDHTIAPSAMQYRSHLRRHCLWDGSRRTLQAAGTQMTQRV